MPKPEPYSEHCQRIYNLLLQVHGEKEHSAHMQEFKDAIEVLRLLEEAAPTLEKLAKIVNRLLNEQ